MSEHLPPAMLSALADGELSAAQVAAAKQHFSGCSVCASYVIDEWLVKTATARAGHRFDVPDEFQKRMESLVSEKAETRQVPNGGRVAALRRRMWAASIGWAAAAVLLFAIAGVTFLQRHALSSQAEMTRRAALVAEATDLHIASLAVSQPPEVVSSDRHTVKPWFQGKLPFAFNIPENLPNDTRLDGANLIYLHNRPAAQLLFNIGKHSASVFVEQKTTASAIGKLRTANAGFQVMGFSTDDLEVVGVSDVDPVRLDILMQAIQAAQGNPAT